MIDGQSVLAIIPARGGSKGVPGKNIRDLGGKPLLAWTIEAAQRSRHIDRCVLSSDDPDIIAVARKWGCEVPFVRPAQLATDESPVIDTILHVLENLTPKYQYLVLLQPTSPLRTADDIDRCIERCHRHNAPACVSVTPATKSPFWSFTLSSSATLQPVISTSNRQSTRRQDLPKAYNLNGAVYVARTTLLQQKGTFLCDQTIGDIMPPEHSIDIDTEMDFQFAHFFITRHTAPDVSRHFSPLNPSMVQPNPSFPEN